MKKLRSVNRPHSFRDIFYLFLITHKSSELSFKLFSVRQIQLIAAYKKLIGDILESILHDQLVLICTEYQAYRFGVTLSIHFLLVVVEIEIHLSNIFMLNLTNLQIDKNKAFQDTMIKNEIDLIRSACNNDFLLSADIGKALSEFKEELAQIINKSFFQIALFVNGQIW